MSCPFRVVLPLLAIPLLLACLGSTPEPHRTSLATPAAREGYVDAGGGVRLFYRTVGTGRDTVVVLHGGPGFTMDYLADDLTPLAARHTLLFYDQRGTGRSSLVSDSAALDGQRFAEDLEAVRQHFGIGRLTLLGHSWGAGVAALYAARYPERVARLLVVGPIPARRAELREAFAALDARRDSVTRREMQEWSRARVADPGDAAACRAYYVLWFSAFFGDPAAAGRSKGDFCAGTPEALRNKMASVDRFTAASLGEWDWLPSLRALTAPALVIHGTSDPLPVASARRWAAALPNGRFLLLQGIGHFPYVEAPERFFAAVEEFLQGEWPAGAQRVAAGEVDPTVAVDTAGDTARTLYRAARARIQVVGQGERWFAGELGQPRGPGVTEPCLMWAQSPLQGESPELRFPPIYQLDDPDVRRVQVSARYYGRSPGVPASVYRAGADTTGERWREVPDTLRRAVSVGC